MTAPARTPAMPEPQGRFTPYPKYKDSGVEWLGEVPEGWEVLPLKHVAKVQLSNVDKHTVEGQDIVKLCNYVDVYKNSIITANLPFMTASASAEQITRLSLQADDVIITKDSETPDDIAVPAYVPDTLENVVCGYHLALIRPSSVASGIYLFRFFQSQFGKAFFSSRANGVTRFAIGKEFIENVPFIKPPLKEQTTIAAFLDRETAKVDALIEKQRQLIELLKEKRQAVISHAVTKGLNPAAPMKDSGIPWLGMVPEHWKIVRNKGLFMEIDDRAETDEGELLSVSHITGITPRSEKNVNMFLAETLEGYKRCQKDDLIINTMWAWMGALGISPCQGVVSPSYNVYRLRNADELYPDYYDYLCRTPQHVGMIKTNSTGVWESRLRLYPQIFFSQYTCVPPYQEQIQIVRYLNAHLKKIATILADCNRTINLLQERRAALITAAVTGKIDVRSAA